MSDHSGARYTICRSVLRGEAVRADLCAYNCLTDIGADATGADVGAEIDTEGVEGVVIGVVFHANPVLACITFADTAGTTLRGCPMINS